MDKHVRAAVIRRDKTEPLGVVEPLDSSFCHDTLPSLVEGRNGVPNPSASMAIEIDSSSLGECVGWVTVGMILEKPTVSDYQQPEYRQPAEENQVPSM